MFKFIYFINLLNWIKLYVFFSSLLLSPCIIFFKSTQVDALMLMSQFIHYYCCKFSCIPLYQDGIIYLSVLLLTDNWDVSRFLVLCKYWSKCCYIRPLVYMFKIFLTGVCLGLELLSIENEYSMLLSKILNCFESGYYNVYYQQQYY